MANVDVVKYADREYVFYGLSNKVRYSVMITNNEVDKITCVRVQDILSQGARFIPGTMNINGCQQNLLGIDYPINVGAIPSGGNTILSFDVEVLSCSSITEITNQAIVTYCDAAGEQVTVSSTVITLPVIKLDVCMKKTVDKSQALIGELLSYSISTRNQGNIPIDNVMFTDDVSTCLQIIPASVIVNGDPQYLSDLSEGINLGTLAPQSGAVVSFQAEVINYPTGGIITNSAEVNYQYTVMQDTIPVTSIGEACSNPVGVKIINKVITC